MLTGSARAGTDANLDRLTSALLDYLASQADVTPLQLSSSANMSAYLLEEGDNDLSTFVNSHNIALEMTTRAGGGVRVNGLFNHEALHTSPIALNAIGNMLFKYGLCL